MFGDQIANPQCWPIVNLADVSEVISGVAKGRTIAPNEAVELPYMRVANVKDGHLDLTEVKTIQIKRSEIPKLRIQVGDLLMTEGRDPDKLGRAALWSGEIDSWRSDRTKILPEYLRSLASSAYGKAYFLSVAKKTTGITSINKTQLSGFPVQLPPKEQQKVFAERVRAIESVQRQQELASDKPRATFQALTQRAFATGTNERQPASNLIAMAGAA